MATETGEERETVGMATTTVERGHERHDASVRWILGIAAGLIGLCALIQVVLYFHMKGLWRLRQRALPAPSPVASALPSEPPAPRLETAPALDLRALRAAEDAMRTRLETVITHVPDRALVEAALAQLADALDVARAARAAATELV